MGLRIRLDDRHFYSEPDRNGIAITVDNENWRLEGKPRDIILRSEMDFGDIMDVLRDHYEEALEAYIMDAKRKEAA
ncbi:hypothetical protein AB204_13005 [Xenorhabdus khoisanae]|uniref:Uncharacterized protein n=1 Tax=Xenorhabdus khoisanae TaxID=880157 RepID=A0A0J5FQZ7_9GAMM|nr:hypothetical protein [Xenorhabdus khoisanae]KMJ44688.1 hypothetical protein AB204_13005 [Xenorhabdus khoisanae]